MKKDKYIGTIINNYKILERIFIKSKDGHAIYKARCIKCGYIKYDRISNFKRYNVGNICNHFEKKAHWYSDSGRGWAKRLHIGTNQINRWKREKGLEFCENKIRVLLNNK